MAEGSKKGFSLFKTWLKINLITVINASVTAMLVTIVVIVLLSQAAILARRTSEESTINLAGRTASEMQTHYFAYFNTVKSISEMMADYDYIEPSQRRRYVNDILMGIINVNRTLVSVYSIWKPDALDGMDAAFSSTTGADAAGQFLSGFTRERGWVEQRSFDEYKHLLDIEYVDTDNEQGIVTDPEPKLVTGFGNIWALDMQIPVIVGPYFEREVVGVVGITVNLGALQTQVELVMSPRAGRIMLCSESGAVIAHTDPALQGLSFMRFMPASQDPLFPPTYADELFSSIATTISTQRYAIVNTDSSLIVSYPIIINDLNAISFDAASIVSPPWAVVTAIPLSIITEPVNNLLRFSVFFIIGAGIVAALVVFLTSRSITQQSRNMQRALEHSSVLHDSLRYGLFLMDQSYTVQGAYSKALERILSAPDLQGKNFIDLLSSSLKTQELDGLKDYLEMVFKDTFDKDMLRSINPINEFSYVKLQTSETKLLRTTFALTERGGKFIMVTMEDITAEKELERQLQQAETIRENEMRSLFQVIQLDPRVLSDFVSDAEYEFENINDILKNRENLQQNVLVEMYQSVHAIKSNALILNLEGFAGRLHKLESSVKKLQEIHEGEVPFDDFLGLILQLNEAMKEMDQVKNTVSKIENFRNISGGDKNQDRYVLVETLSRVCEKTRSALNKKVRFTVEAIDTDVLDFGPRRVMKEVLTQLVRNAVYHGIEEPEQRVPAGKEAEGEIRLSVKRRGSQAVINLTDDGAGIDFSRIRQSAEAANLFASSGEEIDKNQLVRALFSPGFSTLEGDKADFHAGRGIGLSLVRDRVRELHGNITVSTTRGVGTTFTITLPLDIPAETANVS